MGYILLFIVVFVTVVLIKGSAGKKKISKKNDYMIDVVIYNEDGVREEKVIPHSEFIKMSGCKTFDESQQQKTGKIAELNRKMEEKTAWMEADTKRMQAERARRKAAKKAEKQARIDFKNRNK